MTFREARERAGLTCEDVFALADGVSAGVIQRADSDNSYVPGPSHAAKLARALSCDPVALFGPRALRKCRVRRCKHLADHDGALCRNCHLTLVVWPLPPPLVTKDMPRQGWMKLAGCAEVDPELFYLNADDGGVPDPAVIAACAGCSVRGDCLITGMRAPKRERFGIWGGMTINAMKALARQLAREGIDVRARDSYVLRALLPD